MLGPQTILDPTTIPLPDLLDDGGMLKLLPSSHYDAITSDSLRLWCHQNARYGLPTLELIGWLKYVIGVRLAIEIGAGSGDLSHHLGILGTDSWLQERPEIQEFYRLTGQPTIRYSKGVQRLDAEQAIAKYRPDVVVASWVTHWIDPNLPFPPGGGNIYGVDEGRIVDSGVTYILIGNETVHGTKKIFAKPHQEFNLPFVRSRASHPEKNRVWIWNGESL
jgi:hypothetical protein